MYQIKKVKKNKRGEKWGKLKIGPEAVVKVCLGARSRLTIFPFCSAELIHFRSPFDPSRSRLESQSFNFSGFLRLLEAGTKKARPGSFHRNSVFQLLTAYFSRKLFPFIFESRFELYFIKLKAVLPTSGADDTTKIAI